MGGNIEKQKKLTIWTKGFTCAFLANICLGFSQNCANTLISTYAAFLGAGAVLVGTISGLYFGVAFAARPFAGPILTILDKKKIMIVTYLLGIVTNLVYAMSGDVPMFVVARVLHGLQFAFVGSLNMTIASDSLPKEKLGSGIGFFGVANSLATMLGPSLGIAVRDWGISQWGEAGGYTVVFLMSSLFMVIGLIPVFLMPSFKPTEEARKSVGAWYKNIIATETLAPAAILCLLGLSSILLNTYMVPYSVELGIPSIGIYFTVYAVVLLAVRPICGKLLDTVSMNLLLIPGFLIFASSFIVIGCANGLPMLLVGAVLSALGFGVINPTFQAMCMRTVIPARRGVASNTQYFGVDLGYFLGPTFGGMVYAATGTYSTMYLINGLVPTMAALLLFLVCWPKLKNRLY